nr:hypothetical protein HmN_000981500 [Hymenolepis microstoma]
MVTFHTVTALYICSIDFHHCRTVVVASFCGLSMLSLTSTNSAFRLHRNVGSDADLEASATRSTREWSLDTQLRYTMTS